MIVDFSHNFSPYIWVDPLARAYVVFPFLDSQVKPGSAGSALFILFSFLHVAFFPGFGG